jgi:hypothetical protein
MADLRAVAHVFISAASSIGQDVVPAHASRVAEVLGARLPVVASAWTGRTGIGRERRINADCGIDVGFEGRIDVAATGVGRLP